MNNKIFKYDEVFDKKYNSVTERLESLAKVKENKAKGFGYPILYRYRIDLNPKNDVFLKSYTYRIKRYSIVVNQRLRDWQVFINGTEKIEYFNEFPTLEFIKKHFYLD